MYTTDDKKEATVGGAILNSDNSTASIINSTFSGNSAAAGGGLFTSGVLVTLDNTIIANSLGGGDCLRLSGALDASHSLIADGLGCVNGINTNNLTGDPLLGPLQDNGGATFTHALLAGSPAINAGDNDNVPAGFDFDQRGAGFPRIRHGTVDMGAFELLIAVPPTANPTQDPPANANDWNNKDVTVTWNWADNADGSGLDPANCITSSTSSGEGMMELTATCTDLAGNTGSASYTVQVDKTPPTASPTQDPPANANGWNNTDVTVTWNWVDNAAPSGQPSGITGFFIAAMIALYTLTGNVYFVAAIVVDYGIRAFTPLPYSPFSWLAQQVVAALRLPVHHQDKAPKIFAARVGFLFALATVVLYPVYPTASLMVGLTLMSFALLESLVDLCVGCLVYTHVVWPLLGER